VNQFHKAIIRLKTRTIWNKII